jgi:hypothetical protein
MLLKSGSQLDDEALRTLLYEVMAIVNSRPLTVDNLEDPMSLQPLTPNRLLTMKSRIVLPPPGSFPSQDLLVKKRGRRVQQLANEFWAQWRKEFISSLQPHIKNGKRDMRASDVVLICDADAPRNM